MVKKFGKKLITILLAVMMVASLLPMHAFATTVNVLDGQISITDTANSNSIANGIVTITAKGSLFSQKTNTITITNETEEQATVKFDYSASSAAAFSIGGTNASTSGSYSQSLASKETITIVITSNKGLSGATATLTLENFSLKVAAASSNVTVEYDGNLGSVTADGISVESGHVKENVTPSEGITLVATPKSGSEFLGWINKENNEVLSSNTSFTLKPDSNITVKALFVNADSAPHFSVGIPSQKSVSKGEVLGISLGSVIYQEVSCSYIFESLERAVEKASSDATSKIITLMNNATLSAGTYTIPSGVTLLIPFDDANSLYTTEVVSTETYTQPTAYRTLTMADGANLVINGAVSLSAKMRTAQGSQRNGGSPTGAVSFIKMEGDSNITVNNGGVLYAYGFITGSGSVIANSGAQVHENFQFMDFRGGSQTTDMDNGVFPLSQYYVQNIEVPLTLNYGATEYAYTTITMSGGAFGSAVDFIGPSDAMFNLTSGSVTKYYDGSRDRLVVDVNGSMSISPITMKIGLSNSLNSEKYELPVNSNISINVNNGSELYIAQDVAFLPGTEVIVKDGAVCILNEGVSIYIYDSDEWGGYAAPQNVKIIPITYAPGKKYVRTEADLVDAMVQIDGYIDASLGNVYTTAGGANIFSTGTGGVTINAGTQACTHQITQASDVSNSAYTEIPLTPARLKNADGSFTIVEKHTTNPSQYKYEDGIWKCIDTHVYSETVVTEPTCTENGKSIFVCDVCGDSYDEITAALDHSYDNGVETAPTCTDDGYLTYTCHCGDKIEVPSGKFATGHSEEAVVTAPTCTEQGYTTYTCSTCGNTRVDDYVDEKGHSHEAVVTAPTCTEAGYTTYTCACGDTYVADEVDALGHSHGDWEIEIIATHSNEGKRIRKCACGDIETEAIPMIVCDVNADDKVDAADLAEMKKLLINKITVTAEVEALMDMDDNGTVNILDLVKLKKYIAVSEGAKA